MKQQNKNRKNLQHILDFIDKIQGIYQKDNAFSEDVTRPAVENYFIKMGEVIKRLGDSFAKNYVKKYRDFRNDLAHKIDIPLNKLQNFIQDLTLLQSEVKAYFPQNKHKNEVAQNFEDFAKIGTQEDRGKIVDALIDHIETPQEEDKIAFPASKETGNYVKNIQKIIDNQELITTTQTHETIASEVIEETLGWLKETAKKVGKIEDLQNEADFLAQNKAKSISNFVKSFHEMKEFLKQYYYKKDFDLSFYERELQNNTSNEEALKANFFNTWEGLFIDRKLKLELAEIDKERDRYCQELYNKIEKFNKIKDLLSSFTKDLGRLWDLSAGVWKDVGFDIIQKYADILEKDNKIQELAELLGKYRKAEKEWEEAFFEKTILKNDWKAEHSTKSEYVGIYESNDLNSLLPTEVAFLAEKDMQNIFFAKFIDKRLQTFEYQNHFLAKEEIKKEKRLQEKETDKGSFIICVDTSGSMHGTPEYVAKVLSFAILKLAIEENRNCYLISFSTQIQTLDLANLPNSLDKIVEFLRLSFNGGTDTTPALKHAIGLLESKNYKKSDVIVISDFVMPKFDEDTKKRILKAKEDKAIFHSLTISSVSNQEVINDFDYNWFYNTQNPHAVIDLVKNMKSKK